MANFSRSKDTRMSTVWSKLSKLQGDLFIFGLYKGKKSCFFLRIQEPFCKSFCIFLQTHLFLADLYTFSWVHLTFCGSSCLKMRIHVTFCGSSWIFMRINMPLQRSFCFFCGSTCHFADSHAFFADSRTFF